MKNKILVSLVVLSFVALPFISQASTLDDVMAQIKVLQQQVSKLQTQASALALGSVSSLLSATRSTTPVTTPTKTTTVVKSTTIPKTPTTRAPSPTQSGPCAPTDPASITVLSPNGGETFTPGQHVNVTWDSCNVPASTQLSIYVAYQNNYMGPFSSTNSGSSVIGLYSQSSWPPSMPFGTNFKVHIIGGLSSGATILDDSDSLFTINSTTTTTSGTPKVYRAIVNQLNQSAPTAIVLENNLGFNFTWSRIEAGNYRLNAAPGSFLSNKTFVTVTPGYTSSIVSATPAGMDGSQFAIFTGKSTGNPAFTMEDNALFYTYLQILVYP